MALIDHTIIYIFHVIHTLMIKRFLCAVEISYVCVYMDYFELAATCVSNQNFDPANLLSCFTYNQAKCQPLGLGSHMTISKHTYMLMRSVSVHDSTQL